MRNIIIALAIIGVVLASGCTMEGFDFFKMGIGNAEINIEENDIIKVQNMKVIGEEPILDGTSFTIYFEIKNMHDKRDVKKINAYLTNWEPCKILKIREESVLDGQARYTLLDSESISAGGVEAVEIELKAVVPTKELPGKCSMQYLIEYEFDAKTSFSGISIIDPSYLRELRRAEKAQASKPRIDIGIGPLKIMFESDVSIPVEASDDVKKYISMTMWIENRGSETYGDIKAGDVKLQIPKDFLGEGNDEGKCNKFDVEGGGAHKIGGIEFLNLTNEKYSIPMIRGQSTKIRCKFVSPGKQNVVTEKEYFILADMNYKYKIRGEKLVGTKPSG